MAHLLLKMGGMKLAIDVSPASRAEWIELCLCAVEGIEVELTTPPDDVTEPPSILVVDVDSPASRSLKTLRLAAADEWTNIIALGGPESVALSIIDWPQDRTQFVAKPFSLENLKSVVEITRDRLLADHAEAEQAALHEEGEEEEEESIPDVAPPKAQEPVPVAAPARPPAKTLGYLSTLRLSDLMQMLSLNRWTGVIMVEELETDTHGEIYMKEGLLLHAQARDSVSEEACYLMLGWGRCHFTFNETPPTVEKTIVTRTEEVLMEAARRIDVTEDSESESFTG